MAGEGSWAHGKPMAFSGDRRRLDFRLRSRHSQFQKELDDVEPFHRFEPRADHRLAFLSKGDIPPDGLKPHTDLLKDFPYLGTPHQPAN